MDLNTILDLVKTYVMSVVDQLNLLAIAFPLILAISGVSFIFLARRVTRVFKRENAIADDDKFMLTIKLFGLLLIFVAMLMVVFQSLN